MSDACKASVLARAIGTVSSLTRRSIWRLEWGHHVARHNRRCC
jgi:hypothetical protein